ncbi:serine/threonine-protein kinase pim-2-like [Arapaima gigas]
MKQQFEPQEQVNIDGRGTTLCRPKSSINFRETQGQTDRDLSSFMKRQRKQSQLLPQKRSWVHIKNETGDQKEAVSGTIASRCQNTERGEDWLIKNDMSSTETLQTTREEARHQANILSGDQTITPFPSCCSRLHRKASFSARYTVRGLIGKGGCGVVFDGIRKCDKKRVAIKYVPKTDKYQYLQLSKDKGPIPKEVALMQILSHPPKCCYILQLLEWIEKPDHYILVLEQPLPCQDMLDFIARSGGHFQESTAQAFMNQVVLAVKYCQDRGVLHRDIKLENILVQTDTMKIKLIDFGCGDLLHDTVYNTFAGTKFYCPPEWMLDGEYLGGPATIWSLGVLLFELVCGWMPFRNKKEIITGHLHFKDSISEKCQDLICWCLQQDPRKRPVLEQILKHDWMNGL